MRRKIDEGTRHMLRESYVNKDQAMIIEHVVSTLKDPTLAENIYFGPTAYTHIKRLITNGGTIIADTELAANDINQHLISNRNVRVISLIDEPAVVALAEQKKVTRAEVAVDYAMTIPGLKLMVIGSAPAAINRLLLRRAHEPMTEICVLAAPSGFASVIQLKERLIDSDLCSIVVRGKKGNVQITTAILNAILQQITDTEN